MCEYLDPESHMQFIDIRCFEPEVSPTDIILTYGSQAQRKLQNVQCGLKLELPDLDRLDTAHGDPELIRLAQEKLKKFRELLNSDTKQEVQTVEDPTLKQCLNLTEELPANLSASDIKILEGHQIKQGKTYWTGVTAGGKSIRITVEPEEDTADINITFAELYAVIGLRDILRVQELEFVYKPSTATRKSSTQ